MSASDYSLEGVFRNLKNFFTQNVPKGCTPDFLYHCTKPEVLPHICKQHGRLLIARGTVPIGEKWYKVTVNAVF